MSEKVRSYEKDRPSWAYAAMLFAMVAGLLVASFAVGVAIAWITPGGWEAWRIGCMFAAMTSAVPFLIAVIYTATIPFRG